MCCSAHFLLGLSVADYIKYLSYLLSLTVYIYIFLIIFLTINPCPPCQLFLWEEAGEPGENPTTFGGVLAYSSRVPSWVEIEGSLRNTRVFLFQRSSSPE